MQRTRVIALVAGLALGAVTVLAVPAGAAANAGDQTVAQAGILTAADFGSGWAEKPYSSSENATADVKKIPVCKKLGRVIDIVGNTDARSTRAHSPAFSQAGITVDNNVTLLADSAAARKAVAAVASSSMRDCLEQVGKQSIAKLKKSDPATAKLLKSSSVKVASHRVKLDADQTAGIELVVTLKATSGQVAHEILDLSLARVGRALAAYSVAYGPAATAQLPDRALAPSLARLRTAVASLAS